MFIFSIFFICVRSIYDDFFFGGRMVGVVVGY